MVISVWRVSRIGRVIVVLTMALSFFVGLFLGLGHVTKALGSPAPKRPGAPTLEARKGTETGPSDVSGSSDLPPAAQPGKLPERGPKLIWPVTGRISESFGWRVHPLTGAWSFHEGIDIAQESGTKVVAAADGTVKFAGWVDGYGRTVLIEHGGGLETRYAHLAKTLVKAGEKVTRGQAIGNVGASGDTTGPHCHFEVILNGKPVDPKLYLP